MDKCIDDLLDVLFANGAIGLRRALALFALLVRPSSDGESPQERGE